MLSWLSSDPRGQPLRVREARAGSREKCLVEKPFTPTIAQAKELFALAKAKG